MLLVHLPRLRNLLIPVLFAFTTLMLAAGHAHAEDIDPMGVGDLLPSPESTVPKGQGTLYEDYGDFGLWALDHDYGKWDVLDPTAEIVAVILMALIVVIGAAVVVIVEWSFQLTSLPELEHALSGAISGAAKGLSYSLLPAALAVGAFIAFTKTKDGGGGLGQLAWVAVSGVVSISLLTTPQVWVDGVDTTRQVGASIAMEATAGGISQGGQEFPFKLDHQPTYTGSGRDDMLRKSSDAVWRTYVATPWCLAEFGSFEVCEKYGQDLLDQGTSADDRKEWLQENLTDETVGRASKEWRQGHAPSGRIAVTLIGLIILIIFAALVITLAFASLASLVGALMLLVAGVAFACLWVIPGRPRQWGLRWFDQLLGYTLQSFVVTMTLGCVLVVQVTISEMFGVYGYFPAAGLSIVAAISAFRFRKIIESIVGVSGSTSSPIGAALGLMATSRATRALRGNRRGRRRDRGQRNLPVRTLGGGSDGDGGGQGPTDTGGTGGGGNGGFTFARVPFRPPTPLPPGRPTARAAAALPPARDESTPTPSATPTSLPGDTTRPPAQTPTHAPRPQPLRMTPQAQDTQTHDTAPHDNRTDTAAAPTPPSFRQAPAPGAPGPRVIQGHVIRSTTTPLPPTPGRQAHATQPPPPARRTAPARRPAPSRPEPRRTAPARPADVPAPREG
ncbi:hypothetical protein [Streptomyces laurentii]|uniref:hypothetical protein n=1 Tax=Streptomyces laurentii TaxID=39478 RepID=UPI0036B50FC5